MCLNTSISVYLEDTYMKTKNLWMCQIYVYQWHINNIIIVMSLKKYRLNNNIILLSNIVINKFIAIIILYYTIINNK